MAVALSGVLIVAMTGGSVIKAILQGRLQRTGKRTLCRKADECQRNYRKADRAEYLCVAAKYDHGNDTRAGFYIRQPRDY